MPGKTTLHRWDRIIQAALGWTTSHLHTFTAGGTMVAGGYGPYRVGRGPNRPTRAGSPTTIGDNGVWDFDRFQGPFAPNGAETDSLQGWWPVARCYQSGFVTFGDFRLLLVGRFQG